MENEQKQPIKRVKLGGRAKGTPNKVTLELRLRISDFLSDNFATLEKKMKQLEPEAYCRTYTALIPFILAKQRELTLSTPPELHGFRFIVETPAPADEST